MYTVYMWINGEVMWHWWEFGCDYWLQDGVPSIWRLLPKWPSVLLLFKRRLHSSCHCRHVHEQDTLYGPPRRTTSAKEFSFVNEGSGRSTCWDLMQALQQMIYTVCGRSESRWGEKQLKYGWDRLVVPGLIQISDLWWLLPQTVSTQFIFYMAWAWKSVSRHQVSSSN